MIIEKGKFHIKRCQPGTEHEQEITIINYSILLLSNYFFPVIYAICNSARKSSPMKDGEIHNCNRSIWESLKQEEDCRKFQAPSTVSKERKEEGKSLQEKRKTKQVKTRHP